MAEQDRSDESRRVPRNPEGEEVSIDNRDDRAAAEREVAERHAENRREPHERLNNPVGQPDPTEYPDPYERRPDPRDPAGVDTPAHPATPEKAEEADPAPRDPSTSDPPPARNIDAARDGELEPDG